MTQGKMIGIIAGAAMAAFTSSADARGGATSSVGGHTFHGQPGQTLVVPGGRYETFNGRPPQQPNHPSQTIDSATAWWALQQQQQGAQQTIPPEVANNPCAPVLNGYRTPLTMSYYVAARIQQALGLPIDGECGPLTSRAITNEVRRGDRARIGFTILDGQLVTIQGTGEVIRSGAHVQFSIR